MKYDRIQCKRIAIFSIAAGVLVLSLGRFSLLFAQTTPQLVEAAKKEGRLVWYEAMSQSDANALVQQFNKEYPFIKVEIFRLGSAALLSRALAEHQANKTIFDAVSINTASLEIMKEKGMLAKYVSSHDSSYPRGRKDEDGYWTGIYMNTRVIAYNTRLVPPKSAPMSYQDLLQPKWRGEKLGLEVSQPHWYGSVLYIMGPEKGLKFLKDLAAQKPYMTTGLSLTSNLLAAGEFPIQVWAYGTSIEELKEKQAPVDWTGPNPTIVGTSGMGLAKAARNPTAARLFYEWMLSREGQEALVAIAKIPSRSGVSPNPRRLTAGLTFYNQPENPMNKAFDKIARLVKVIFSGAPGNAEALTKEIFAYGWPKTEDYISRPQ